MGITVFTENCYTNTCVAIRVASCGFSVFSAELVCIYMPATAHNYRHLNVVPPLACTLQETPKNLATLIATHVFVQQFTLSTVMPVSSYYTAHN